jgi:type VI secretion system protein VasG
LDTLLLWVSSLGFKLKKTLLGRIVIIPYFGSSDDMIKSITRLQLDRIKHRVETGLGIDFVYDDAVADLVISRCTEVESGRRMIDSIITNTLLPKISNQFLTYMLEGSPISKVDVTAKEGEFFYELSY